MTAKLTFYANVKDTDDIMGLCEQIGMCFEELGDIRLVYLSYVKENMPLKVGRGPYKNVMLSDEGVRELSERYGHARAEALIESLSKKLYQKNYRFNDHFAVIVEWEEAERKNPSAFREASSTILNKATSFDVNEFYNAAVRKGIEK
jgi:hypothetical protein